MKADACKLIAEETRRQDSKTGRATIGPGVIGDLIVEGLSIVRRKSNKSHVIIRCCIQMHSGYRLLTSLGLVRFPVQVLAAVIIWIRNANHAEWWQWRLVIFNSSARTYSPSMDNTTAEYHKPLMDDDDLI